MTYGYHSDLETVGPSMSGHLLCLGLRYRYYFYFINIPGDYKQIPLI